ncbi:MAG: hypothetical protein AB1468_00100 [Candidatus Micrarchaeota archaeon]
MEKGIEKEETGGESLKKILAEVLRKKYFYIAIIAVFALFILTREPVFALVAAGLLIVLLAAEIYVGAGTSGWAHEIKETVIAILAAVAIWLALGFLLNTSSPLDAVVSCSMLPNLERGDMVLLQDADPSAPEVNVSREDWGRAVEDLKKMQPVCVGGKISTTDGLVSFECGLCRQKNPSTGALAEIPCVKSVTIAGSRIAPSLENDIIVYEPLPSDFFARSGAIIHRVVAVVNVEGARYYLTKGDNSAAFDVQGGNSPVQRERVKGRVVLRIPYVGYVKLFMSGLFDTPPGCDKIIINDGQ